MQTDNSDSAGFPASRAFAVVFVAYLGWTPEICW
jgi:hypothetical protein